MFGTAVYKLGDIRPSQKKNKKPKATTCTNTEQIYRNERFWIGEAARSLRIWLLNSGGGDPAGSSVPLGPPLMKRVRGALRSTPLSNCCYLLLQFLGDLKKKKKRMLEPPRAASRARASVCAPRSEQVAGGKNSRGHSFCLS